jgi:16S rRNA (guanine(966)-N(2))-methyltransferase RsmD
MRVIAGKYRSRTLRSLRGQAMRPTSDRLRETLFDVLGPAVAGAVFVDLYAGTGAVGIEALSRGARTVVFAENHRPAVELIRANLRALGIESGAEVLAADALRGLRRLASRGLVADFIFADPPYADLRAYGEVLDWLGGNDLLAADGVLILEHAARHSLPNGCGRLKKSRTLRQGDAALSFYRQTG